METTVQMERASLLLEQGRVNDAIKVLNQILQVEPENAGALSLYARCYFKKNEIDQAISMLQSAIRINPLNSYYVYLLGFAYYRKHVNTAALEELQRAVSMNPYNSEYFGMMAHVYIAEKDFQTALLKANEGLAVDAENITCLNARSIALNKLKKTDEAIETMQNALAQDPENEMTHITVGWNLLEKGDHRQAAGHFREALRINPDNENAKNGLKEALKSRIPPYKWMLQYSFWVHNRGKKTKRVMPIIIFVVARLLVLILRSNSETMFFAGIIIGAYLLFVITSWIINPLANFFLLFNEDGKYALDQTEKWTAITVVASLLLGLMTFILALGLGGQEIYSPLIIATLAFWGMTVPLGQLHYPISWKEYGATHKIGLVLISLGLLTIMLAFIYQPAAIIGGIIFLSLFILNNWFGVFRG